MCRAKRPGAMRALAPLLLCIALGLAHGSADNLQLVDQPAAEVVYHGGLQDGWTTPSFGAAVDESSAPLRRPGSPASLRADVRPFAALTLATTTPFRTTGVLDAWLKGSALTSASLSLEDAAGLRSTAPLPLFLPADAAVARLLGPDDDGWFRLQVNLAQLAAGAASPPAGLPDAWDRIVFRDASGGAGFTLLLDDTAIVPAAPPAPAPSPGGGGGVEASCVGAACNPMLDPSSMVNDLVPLYGPDAGIAAAGPAELIARLAPGVTAGHVAALCAELAGVVPADRRARFRGSCVTGGGEAAQAEGAPLDWPYIALTAETEEDVHALRAALRGAVEFFERDHAASIIPAAGASPHRRVLPRVPVLAPRAPPAQAPAPAPGAAPSGDEQRAAAALPPFTTTCPVVPWGLDRLDQAALPLNKVFAPGNLTGRGVHIYVLDTGLRTSHSEFAGRVGGGASCLGGGCRSGAPVSDGNGHGTHTAGIAAGTCYGVAKAAIVHSVKIFDDSGSGAFSDILAGMRWARDDAARNGWPAVLSMSLGGSKSPSVDQAVGDVVAAGFPVVVAAGNSYGADACTGSPGGAPAALTVGSTDAGDRVSSFSNLGRCLDVFAPGSSITSASNANDYGTRVLSGTSMATPAVAGVVALILQAKPRATPQQVADVLFRASVQLQALGTAGSPNRFAQATPRLAQ